MANNKIFMFYLCTNVNKVTKKTVENDDKHT